MKLIDIVRLIKRNWFILVFTPLLLASLVAFLTRKPTFTFSSETILYTGIASGSSVEMDKSLSFFATNTAFDNLINVLKSRETQREVAIRLLAQHLLLPGPDQRYISKAHYEQLLKITPPHVQAMVVRKGHQGTPDPDTSNLEKDTATSFSFREITETGQGSLTLPASISKSDFDQTVANLEDYMASSDTNFVYKLLYFGHPHYSIKAISGVNVQRIASSDLVKLKFTSNDQGICQQTLAMLTEVCIQNYKEIKENRSDAVVKYFEHQLKLAAGRLKEGEDRLLKFNEDNNIINYYEQSKAVAVVKEQLDVEYHNKRIALAGAKAAIRRIEDKLGNQKNIQLKSSVILEKRNQLNIISNKIAELELFNQDTTFDEKELGNLKFNAEKLKDEIREAVSDLYTLGNTVDGLPVKDLLNEWIDNVLKYEELKAGISVLGDRIEEFQYQYAIYAPAGANLKRIEREINVSEQEFLEILHGLNLAKLKVQDAELSSSLKAVDPPFFPLSPIPTKRKIMVIIAALAGFLILFATILALEYFDSSLKNPERAAKMLQLEMLGVFPRIFLKTGKMNFPFAVNRLLEMSIQNLDARLDGQAAPAVVVVCSSLPDEGKSTTTGNLVRKLKKQGRSVLYLNYSDSSLFEEGIGYDARESRQRSRYRFDPMRKLAPVLRLMGYGDSRCDYRSPFLQDMKSFLDSTDYAEYPANNNFLAAREYQDLLPENFASGNMNPEYVFIELPALLYHAFPQKLLSNADLVILACRANRGWTSADQGVLNSIKNGCKNAPGILLNGVNLDVLQEVVGPVPTRPGFWKRVFKS